MGVGENWTMNPENADKHQWYYYPEMVKDDCLLFKTYDKKETGTPGMVFHAAFDDPRCPADAPDRESCEIRAIAFFHCPGDNPERGIEPSQARMNEIISKGY